MADGYYAFQEGPTDPEQPYAAPQRLSPLDVTAEGTVPPIDLAPRRKPEPVQPPAEMRAYEPTWREQLSAGAQAELEGLGMGRAQARRTAQTVLGGPQSNLPLGAGLIDIPVLPSTPLFMQEGYRGTERAAGALERGDYGGAAMEYLGAVGMMAPGAIVARQAVPPVARALKSAGVSLGESMGANAPRAGGFGQSQRGMFLPEQFFTPQEKANINVAQELETKGASPQEVLVQTGLVRDFDGTWAVELSDDKMKFTALEAVERARKPIAIRIEGLKSARGARLMLDEGASPAEAAEAYRATTGVELDPKMLRLAETNTGDQIEEAIRLATASLMVPIRGLKMRDLVQHPELYDRIPKLAEMQVDFVTQKELGKGTLGHFDPTGPGMGTIRALPKYLRPEESYGRSLFAHELQHGIDYAAGKDWGISPEGIKEASDYWANRVKDESINFNAEATALQVRRLMDANPGMSPEQALDEIVSQSNYYGKAEDYLAAGKYNAETESMVAQEGALRWPTLHIAEVLSYDTINQRVSDIQARLREAYDKRRIAAPTEEGRQEQYMTNMGEARARLTETRLDMTPEERQQIFPMEEQFMGLDRPRESLRTREELTGGLFTRNTPSPSLSMGPAGSQRGAVLFGMGGEQQRPLRDLLADQPTTLRTLENLPGKRTELTVQEIQDQMRRPEVTREEKDVLNRVLERSAPGGRISAEDLVREVGLETKDFRLTPADSVKYKDYGLNAIGRSTETDIFSELPTNAQDARTTVHRSPTPTSADNHFRDPNYFGHTRAFMADGIPHVVEIQSDLVQKAGKELSPAERTQLEQQVQTLSPQITALDSVVPRNSREVPEPEALAANLRAALPQLEALNPNARLIIGAELNSSWMFHDMNVSDIDAVDRALSELMDPRNPLRRAAADATAQALRNFRMELAIQQDEATSKLAERGDATAQRPMFKNWERRLIREELSRAATPQETPKYTRLRNSAKEAIKELKEAEAYYREQGLSEGEIASLIRPIKVNAEWFAKSAQETPQYQPIPPTVRFADADTVALVEGWPRKLEYTPGEARDYALEGKRLPGSSAGTANDWRYTGMVRMDENGIWEAERLPIDVDGRVIGAAKWSNSGTAQISEDIINRFVKPTDKFEDAGHQGIYDRYKKEVTNYLKSLGAKPYKDSMGHSWWEVPVKPEQRRTQIFSMGGGAVAAGGAATYNGTEAEAQ